MSQRTQGTIHKKLPSKILGIQFSILSPDEIRKGSVAEITSRDTYENGSPVINGLFDPRMGVLDPGIICPTDGLDYMQTPGYFGHIELAKPIFYIQYLSTIIKILRCICVKCSKLLLSKEKYKHLLSLAHSSTRWNAVFALASKVKRCGEDTNDGCGCKQPSKFKKEGLATITAEWDDIEGIESDNSEKLIMKMTPEIVIKLFRRIQDADVNFMGFSPIWSRPDWMVCQVLAIPPPAVRPSIKHDAQQRSEDDISHIIVNIIKANNTLREKIQKGANSNVINDWATILQYYVATMVDNKIPGVAAVAQRTGRPLKSIKERLNGKHGRVRGNLMGKRVDFSARSVITPDPNISIKELGVPMSIAKNITKPVIVNHKNMSYLLKLVQNGPDVHPGAKILERKNGECISLRYIDRDSIDLKDGDIVHRHMLDGDAILFNRQPTLHRMSMMSHIVRVMPIGDTFRMNVADTKPYNADFDGDEMNLHMPQDPESESELRNLAAVPWQIISPANNKSIVGIFQDSLLGAYLLSRDDVTFTTREAMNLLMAFDKVDTNNIARKSSDKVNSHKILGQILPPLSLKYKTNRFKEGDDYKTSNAVLEIENGKYIRGQLEKGILGDGSRGLIHRICNDFGNMASAAFIDDIQNMVTEYMKSTAYSVGISDLIADSQTNTEITEAITNKKREVSSLIDQTHLGLFENKSGKTNEEEFETQVNNILNQATHTAGKIGRKSLSKDNRFVIMVEAGSKGSDLNISQMISCLGQQNVDGKRIPYGFEDRTLPHFNKYDDSPSARGFVESSFISGLTPTELFFHAMGGRVGIIDTAVKTSQTGYIQRRLVKGLEDIKIEYDMTVRNNQSKIIQYSYGEDGFDTVKVENQILPLVKMSLEEIYAHFQLPMSASGTGDAIYTAAYTNAAMKRLTKQKTNLRERCKQIVGEMIRLRKLIIENVFKNRDNSKVHIPCAFEHIINNVQGQQFINVNSMVDITPFEAFQLIDAGYERLEKIYYVKPTELFKTMYYYYLSPKVLLTIKRFNRKAIMVLIEQVILMYKKAIIAPGEMVGIIAAQSIGEPTTQMTLNTFHFAGVASKSNVTRGVPRIEEILSLSENPKNPSCTIHLFPDEETDQNNAQKILHRIQHTKLRAIVDSIQICFDPNDSSTSIQSDTSIVQQYRAFENMVDGCLGEDIEETPSQEQSSQSKWIIRMEMNAQEMLEHNITMDDVHFAIKNTYHDDVNCLYNDYNSDNLVFHIRLTNKSKKANVQKSLDQSDEIYILQNFQTEILDNLVLRGIKHISRVIPRKITDSLVEEDGAFVKKVTWVIDTVGTNLLDVLGLDYIDANRSYTNDIQEIYRVLGIEAARQAIFNEISEVIEFDSTYINYHHLSVLCDRMTCNSKMVSIFRHGINNDNIGPIAKASFEETPEMFLKAARHAELDSMRGVSANVMCGQEGFFGTSAFQTVLDIDEMVKLSSQQWKSQNEAADIEAAFGDVEDTSDQCSVGNIAIKSNIHSIKSTNVGSQDDDYDMGF
jgi:DNA-directed RNA polymerase II subunit RPB1